MAIRHTDYGVKFAFVNGWTASIIWDALMYANEAEGTVEIADNVKGWQSADDVAQFLALIQAL